MPNRLSENDFISLQFYRYKNDLNGFYTYLADRGYSYASWARGVANEDTITGLSAVNYLSGSALMGIGSEACKNLSAAQMNGIKLGMADEYLSALKNIYLNGESGRDVNAKEVWKFHQIVFKENGVGIENWTLNIPFLIIQRKYGDAAVEKYWQIMRETKGEGFSGVSRSFLTLLKLIDVGYFNEDPSDLPGALIHGEDPLAREMAQKWVENVIGGDDITSWLRFIGNQTDTVLAFTVGSWLENKYVPGMLWLSGKLESLSLIRGEDTRAADLYIAALGEGAPMEVRDEGHWKVSHYKNGVSYHELDPQWVVQNGDYDRAWWVPGENGSVTIVRTASTDERLIQRLSYSGDPAKPENLVLQENITKDQAGNVKTLRFSGEGRFLGSTTVNATSSAETLIEERNADNQIVATGNVHKLGDGNTVIKDITRPDGERHAAELDIFDNVLATIDVVANQSGEQITSFSRNTAGIPIKLSYIKRDDGTLEILSVDKLGDDRSPEDPTQLAEALSNLKLTEQQLLEITSGSPEVTRAFRLPT